MNYMITVKYAIPLGDPGCPGETGTLWMTRVPCVGEFVEMPGKGKMVREITRVVHNAIGNGEDVASILLGPCKIFPQS